MYIASHWPRLSASSHLPKRQLLRIAGRSVRHNEAMLDTLEAVDRRDQRRAGQHEQRSRPVQQAGVPEGGDKHRLPAVADQVEASTSPMRPLVNCTCRTNSCICQPNTAADSPTRSQVRMQVQ